MEVEEEIRLLKQRVDCLEGAVNVLTGHIGLLHPELVALRETTAQRMDTLQGLVGKVATGLDTVNMQVWSLRDDMPTLVASALRKAAER